MKRYRQKKVDIIKLKTLKTTNYTQRNGLKTKFSLLGKPFITNFSQQCYRAHYDF